MQGKGHLLADSRIRAGGSLARCATSTYIYTSQSSAIKLQHSKQSLLSDAICGYLARVLHTGLCKTAANPHPPAWLSGQKSWENSRPGTVTFPETHIHTSQAPDDKERKFQKNVVQ